jgi:putative thioredoxin
MSHEVQDFEQQVIARSREVPVLVDFWAPWCGPCRTLGPVLERMAAGASGRWELVKVNTEDHPELATSFQIASIPAVKLFVNGKVADQFVGALPEREIRHFLDKALPSPAAGQLNEAQQLLSGGKHADAIQILEPLVANDPSNWEARVLLAQALLSVDPERLPRLLAGIPSESDLVERAGALLTLGRLAQSAGNPTSLPEAKVRDRYHAGAAALRAGDFAAALEAFIEVLERNKAYDNGGAKAACKAIFQLLGMRHPLVERFFRAFSSALHS